jgi:hypothetical protein
MHPNIETRDDDVDEAIDAFPAVSELTKNYRKDRDANQIATHLLVTFRYCLLLIVGLGFAVVAFDRLSKDPDQNLVKDRLVPLLTGIGTFASTVFAPLLAFVLGHYFGERSRR